MPRRGDTKKGTHRLLYARGTGGVRRGFLRRRQGTQDEQAVGQPKFSIETHAPRGLPPGITFTRFSDLPSCRDYVHSRGGTLIGVEIGGGARNIDEEPFLGTCAFMPGNEGSGMSEQQKACCDSFVYISQHGGGTASLNVAVAASIVLHRYAGWRSNMGTTTTTTTTTSTPSTSEAAPTATATATTSTPPPPTPPAAAAPKPTTRT
ncbi:unnamed protein product [Ectocarpus sp. CCAP 1310/34]|nr:unnamed protein product [Ectocarpus sp. CCAP 1310/34]